MAQDFNPTLQFMESAIVTNMTADVSKDKQHRTKNFFAIRTYKTQDRSRVGTTDTQQSGGP